MNHAAPVHARGPRGDDGVAPPARYRGGGPGRSGRSGPRRSRGSAALRVVIAADDEAESPGRRYDAPTAGVSSVFVLFRAVTYATLFTGLVLVLLPARVLTLAGVTPPERLGAVEVAGIAVALAGGALAVWCVVSFAIFGKGTPAPFDPPRRLVVRGPYAVVRNPMYVGAGAALLGAALFYRSSALLAFAAALFTVAHLFVTRYEEPVLRRTFGEAYASYCRGVRRWWPRLDTQRPGRGAGIDLEPIGFVRSPRTDLSDDDWGRVRARIELAEPLGAEALEGLDEFSHVEVIFFFDRVGQREIERGARHPRGNPAWPRVGIFAQRGKNRPNRLGSTIARVIARSGRSLEVEGLDAIDGTPVVDLKPVMQEFLPREPVRQPAWSHELMRAYWRRDDGPG